MKYLLLIHMNPRIWETLTEAERQQVYDGHDALQQPLRESGELVGSVALAEPAQTSTVKIRETETIVTDGPYVEAKEFLAGYYIVDCATQERANEIAAMIPDARLTAIEVRPVIHAAGADV
jgi:hypothetical protein